MEMLLMCFGCFDFHLFDPTLHTAVHSLQCTVDRLKQSLEAAKPIYINSVSKGEGIGTTQPGQVQSIID